MGINLNNREAMRLFYDWGFEDDPSPGATGGHWYFVYPPTGQRCTITSPGRHSKTPRRAYEKGAAIVGVPLDLFLLGPKETQRRLEKETALMPEPDPLGIRKKVKIQIGPPTPAFDVNLVGLDPLASVAKLQEAFDSHCRQCYECAPYLGCDPREIADQLSLDEEHYRNPPAAPATPSPPVEEAPVPLYPTAEKVLGALLEAPEPATSRQLSNSLGIRDVDVRAALRHLESESVAFRVGTQPAVRRGKQRGGAPATLWWHEATAPSNKPDPTPEPDPTPAEEPAVTQPVIDLIHTDHPALREARASVALDKGDGQTFAVDGSTPVSAPSVRVFEETEIAWPTGGIVIKDDQGNLYVARPLVEGR